MYNEQLRINYDKLGKFVSKNNFFWKTIRKN